MRPSRLYNLLVSLLAAGVVAVAAHADGLPVLGIDVGGVGVVASSGEERYVTVPAGRNTVVARVSTADGQVVASSLLRGKLTIAAVAYDGSASGLSADGRTLVLIEPRTSFPRAQTRLDILDARRLLGRKVVRFDGDFSFDAISPHGSLLYLIQYVSPTDPTRYLVRAYDVRAGRLLAEPVTDPREPGEKMRGSPLSRASSVGGRWAYTLYDGFGGTPFIHALDTSRRSARCIDLEALADPDHSTLRLLARGDLSALRLRLDAGGGTISVVRGGQPVLAVDTRTFRVSAPNEEPAGRGTAFPWMLLALAALGALVAAWAVVSRVLQRRRLASVS